jgi:hypothetical protein
MGLNITEFIGVGPYKEEDKIKEPLTDKIGQMVDKYLRSLDITDKDLKKIKPKKKVK